MWETLTRDKPHREMDNATAAHLIQSENLTPPVPEHLKSLPLSLVFLNILHACWEVDPSKRPSGKHMVQSIDLGSTLIFFF